MAIMKTTRNPFRDAPDFNAVHFNLTVMTVERKMIVVVMVIVMLMMMVMMRILQVHAHIRY